MILVFGFFFAILFRFYILGVKEWKRGFSIDYYLWVTAVKNKYVIAFPNHFAIIILIIIAIMYTIYH